MSIPRKVLGKYVKGRTLVETGTRWGDTVIRAIEEGALMVVTIESDERMYRIALEHIGDALKADIDKVRVVPGDSLDAHSDKETPILRELEAISKHPIKTHTILIDDMSVYRSGHWAVSVDDIDVAVKAINRGYRYTYEDGVEENDILVARVL
jgi:hypothetical protein